MAEIFFRMARFAEFDAVELWLSSYLLTLDEDGLTVWSPGPGRTPSRSTC